MKLALNQLRKLIKETISESGELVQLSDYQLKAELAKLKAELLDAFDPEDWVMAANGYPAWARQVDNAMTYVKGKVGKDISLVDSIGIEAYEKLMLGEFGEGMNVKWKTKAYDAIDDDLDDEFADFLDMLNSSDGGDYEIEPEDVQLMQPKLDIERERDPVIGSLYPDPKE